MDPSWVLDDYKLFLLIDKTNPRCSMYSWNIYLHESLPKLHGINVGRYSPSMDCASGQCKKTNRIYKNGAWDGQGSLSYLFGGIKCMQMYGKFEVFLLYHGNLRVPPQCQLPPENKA